MKIAINCRSFLNEQTAGIGRYAKNLVQSLSEVDRQNTYLLYVQKNPFQFKKKVPRINAGNVQVKIDRFNLGLNRTLGRVDIYHSPSPDLIDYTGGRIIVTVHDLIYRTYPQGHTPQTIAASQTQMEGIVKQSAKIICCSESTRRDLHQLFDLDESRTCVVYQGVDKELFYPLPDDQKDRAKEQLAAKGVEGPFLLFVGTIEPRKNIGNLLKAFALLKEKGRFGGKLVIAGMQGWMVEGLSGTINELKVKEDVLFLGYVSDEELRFLYNLAEIFVFPSFYEGFGYPLLEAFACGAAVVTSNVSACPEVAADAAFLADPQSHFEIAAKVSMLLESAELKATLREKALRRAGDFSFRKTAEETLRVYEEVHET